MSDSGRADGILDGTFLLARLIGLSTSLTFYLFVTTPGPVRHRAVRGERRPKRG